MRLQFTASKALSALLGLIACSSPALASSARGPDETAASIIEWISNFQQDIQDSRAEAPQAIPPAEASGPRLLRSRSTHRPAADVRRPVNQS